jgi:hypothetical protein
MPEIERTPKGGPTPKRGNGLQPTKRDIDQHADLYRVAYQEGQRALNDQQDELKGMRDRAVSFTAFIGAATAFLVGTGLHANHRDALFYSLAGVASVLSAIFIILLSALLSPGHKRQWHYRMEPKKLITGWIETEVPLPSEAHFFRALAGTYDEMRQINEELLSSLRRLYRWLIVVGAAQITVWAALLWVKN